LYFNLFLCLAVLFLVTSPLIFRKCRTIYRKVRALIDKFIDWLERKQFERWLDEAGR
jgi:hypothetical protein